MTNTSEKKIIDEVECCGLCGMIKVCKLNPPCLHHQDIFREPRKSSDVKNWETELNALLWKMTEPTKEDTIPMNVKTMEVLRDFIRRLLK